MRKLYGGNVSGAVPRNSGEDFHHSWPCIAGRAMEQTQRGGKTRGFVTGEWGPLPARCLGP